MTVQYGHLDLLFDPERLSQNHPGAVATANYQKEEKTVEICITFSQPDTLVKSFFLAADPPQKGSYRLVMDLYPPQRSGATEEASPLAASDPTEIPEETARTQKPAPEGLPGPETKMVPGGSGGSQKIRPLEATSSPAMVSAQLATSDSSEQTPKEGSSPDREVVPLQVPARPTITSPPGFTSRYFHVARPRLGLGLAYQFEEERREGPNIDSSVTSNEFYQRLAIETDGWVYHPALLKYTLRFEPEWSQVRRVSDPGETFTDTPFEPYYAVDAFFLEPKPYTLHGFANRREIKVRGAFATPSDTLIDTYGADLRLKYRVLPTFMKYTHTDTDQTGFFDSTGARDDFQLTSRHLTSKSTTTLNSSYSDNERTSSGVTSRIKTFTGNLGNDYDIAGDRKKRLRSNLSYRWSESDASESSFLFWSENLFWRHTDSLYTDYFLSLETSDSDGFDRDTASFRAKLSHLLYENLTTTVSAGANLNDTTAGRENIYDGNLELFYQRRIPWGNINLRTAFDYRLTDREGFDEDIIQVNNEAHVLETGEVTLLDNQNVFLDSIVVTDETGTIRYIENVDYTVEEVDSFTRISRTLVGDIGDGQTVLVDYRYLSDPTFDDSVFGQAYRVQFYLWNALTLGYGYRKADQHIISGPPPQNRIDDSAHAAEIRLNLGWSDTRFTYEDTDRASGISTTRWLAQQTFRFRPIRRFLANVTTTYGWTKFKDSDETQDQYGVAGTVSWTPAGWCRFRLEGSWKEISGDVQETEDAYVIAALELSYRIWSGGIYYRYSNVRNNEQRQIRNSLRVEIIRILW
jgi:hypothetical protein